jgi:hypothetical protein
MFKKPSAAKVFAISCVKTKNDKGTFFVLDTNVLRDSTNAELNAAYEWHLALGTAEAKVHEEEARISPDSDTLKAASF